MKNAELKEAVAKYIESKELVLMGYSPEYIDDVKTDMEVAFRAGAEWMAGQGRQDMTETPSIFGFYLVIHEKGWCVANYMGKGVVCESGWVEAIHHIEIKHPQKWLDLRDLIPKKQ